MKSKRLQMAISAKTQVAMADGGATMQDGWCQSE
jgi:hypothetical protein